MEVSVVIPSRNRWPLLRHAVTCALDQRHVEHEVIVVLDGSTDESAAQLAAMSERRLSIISYDSQGGIARTRNAGIAAARGHWIAFLDDDDRWSPNKLRHALRAGADHNWVYGGALFVDDALRVVAVAAAPPPETLLGALLVRNLIPAGSSNVVVRRELLQVIGGFDERLVHLADWDAWIRLAEQGDVAMTRQMDVACLEHGSNLSLTDIAGVRHEVDLLESRYEHLAQALGVRLDRAWCDRWIARGQRRAGRRATAARILLQSAVRNRHIGNAARAAEVLLIPLRARRLRRAPCAPDWLIAELPAESAP